MLILLRHDLTAVRSELQRDCYVPRGHRREEGLEEAYGNFSIVIRYLPLPHGQFYFRLLVLHDLSFTYIVILWTIHSRER